MFKKIENLAIISIVLLLGSLLLSCSDNKENVEPKSDVKPIGSYTFEGKQYNLLSGVHAINPAGYYEFMFSPCESIVKDRHTLILLFVKRGFVGEPFDVKRVYHNDDYVFSYEDTFHLYSQYYALTDGTILVEDLGDEGFRVELKGVKLADGKTFSLSFEGNLPTIDELGL